MKEGRIRAFPRIAQHGPHHPRDLWDNPLHHRGLHHVQERPVDDPQQRCEHVKSATNLSAWATITSMFQHVGDQATPISHANIAPKSFNPFSPGKTTKEIVIQHRLWRMGLSAKSPKEENIEHAHRSNLKLKCGIS